MCLSDNTKYALAKNFTELAIQNGLFECHKNAADTASERTTFFNTIVDTIEGNTDNQ